MKKIITTSLILASLLLVGCKQSSAPVSEANNIIIKNGNKSYSKQDLFEDMKGQDYGPLVVGKLANQIALKEGFTAEELEQAVNQQLSELKNAYKENYEVLLKNYGGENSLRKIILGNLSQAKLFEKYLQNNLESFTQEYSPVKAQIVYFDSNEVAQEFIQQVKAGGDFEKLAIEKGFAVDAGAKVYTDKDTDVLYEIKAYFNDETMNGLSEPLVAMTTTTDSTGNKIETARYYVVNILERNVEKFSNEFITMLQTKVAPTEALSYYFNEHEVHFHDQRTYDLLVQQYKGIR